MFCLAGKPVGHKAVSTCLLWMGTANYKYGKNKECCALVQRIVRAQTHNSYIKIKWQANYRIPISEFINIMGSFLSIIT